MSLRLHIGADGLRGDLAAYAKRFGLLEVSRAGKAPPSVATLKRWRKAVAPSFEFVAVAGPGLSKLKDSPELEKDLKETIETINVLEARCMLIRTPADVTPSPVWRERMARLLERLPRDATHVAWEPRGLWEVEEAAVAAKKWGVVLVVDASRDPVPVGQTAYVRLPARGETRSYGTPALERVALRISERRDAYVVFETDGALAEAKRLRRILTELRTQAKPSRVVRPRSAPLRVRDDEQE